jgi:hypothetical protein
MSHIDEGQIHAYLDRQLEFQDPLARERFEAHMAECSECAALLEEASVPDAVAVPPFDRVVTRAGKQAGRTTRIRQLVRTRNLAWAASIVLAVAVGWYARVSTTTSRPGDRGVAEPALEAAPSAERAFAAESAQTGDTRGAPRAPTPLPRTATPDVVTGAQQEAAGRRSQAESELSELARERERRVREGQGGAAVPAQRQQAQELASKVTAQPARDSVRRDMSADEERARGLSDVAVPVAADAFALGNEAAWTAISRDDAATILGRPVVSVDGLDVVEIAASGTQPGTVRVIQRLPSGDSLEVLQRRATPELDQVAGMLQTRAAEATARRREDADARRAQAEARPAEAPAATGPSSLLATWEDLRIEMRGKVSGDSLQVLLSRLREAPGSN